MASYELGEFRRNFAVAEERISRALRSAIWRRTRDGGLTPTQSAILSILRYEPAGLRLSAIASQLGVSAASASDSVSSLVEKRLARRGVARDDARAVAIRLTDQGAKLSENLSAWPEALSGALDALSRQERGVLLRGLMKVIHGLEREDQLSGSASCVSCRQFQPYVNNNEAEPHYCAGYDVSFGDNGLRFECGEYHRAGNELAGAIWARFSYRGEIAEPRDGP